ncbi:MAG: hypothetical protein COA46_07770 [Porticoccaceae bacterium]|nr:MAG: hypothetical protein COA46_07770 [Porticoccaceae bacterium]
MLDTLLKICGGISVIAAAIVVFYKLYRNLQPISTSISYTLDLRNDVPDSIEVEVTNRSSSPVYIKSCEVRCTYSFMQLTVMHLKRPFLRPSLYPNLRYNSCVYEFIEDQPVKLEASELKALKINIHEHPLNALYGPLLISFTTLTTGRVMKSKKMPSPPVWKTIGMRGKGHA